MEKEDEAEREKERMRYVSFSRGVKAASGFCISTR